MNLKHFCIAVLMMGVSSVSFAKTDVNLKDAASKFIPNSKVVKVDGHEIDLQTAKGTVVEVELNRDGTLDEASGDAVNGGDQFVPGDGLMSLEQAIAALKTAGKSPTGDWKLKKSMMNGWVYEFDGQENGKDMEYAISAKDGKLVKDRREIL